MAEDAVKDIKEEPFTTKTITLSFKQIAVAGSVLLTIVGSAFGIGMKLQRSIDEIIINDKEGKHQEEIAKIETTIGRQLKEAQADHEFYKGRYIVTKTRLDACLKDKNFVESIIE